MIDTILLILMLYTAQANGIKIPLIVWFTLAATTLIRILLVMARAQDEKDKLALYNTFTNKPKIIKEK